MNGDGSSPPASRTTAEPGRPAAARARRSRPAPAVLLAVACGGALGALARHGLAVRMPADAGAFPWGTFWTNVAGCLLIGVLMVLIVEVAGRPHRLLRPFVGVGLLGGFTTFSTYAVHTHELLAEQRQGTALAYLFGTLVAALLATETGMMLTRWATRRRRGRGPEA